ncbi:MAG TPA: four helix bundle protein [Terriglobales bacterium]|nr:four helix bundle protein [Terriglobales bacterium]
MRHSSFQDLRVWQDAMKLTEEVYRQTAGFPKHEVYGLSQQIRRAAVSVPSNIAEGKGRRTDKEFSQFLFHARGSLLELETQLMIAQALQYLPLEDSQRVLNLAEGVGRALSGLINSLQPIAQGIRPRTNDQRPKT